MGEWIQGIADVVGNNPYQTDKKSCQHERREPLWALLGKWSRVGYLIRNVNRILLAALGFGHK